LLASGITALKAALAALHKPLLGVFVTHAYLNHCNRGIHDYNHSWAAARPGRPPSIGDDPRRCAADRDPRLP